MNSEFFIYGSPSIDIKFECAPRQLMEIYCYIRRLSVPHLNIYRIPKFNQYTINLYPHRLLLWLLSSYTI